MAQSNLSPRRLAANRANAQKSTGPRSPAGKARSARNRAAFHFYSRGLGPLPPAFHQLALQRAARAAGFFHHDPLLAANAAHYVFLATHHTYLSLHVGAFSQWMFSAADPLAWVARHGSFLRGVLFALSRLRGRLRHAERTLLPAVDAYRQRLASQPPPPPKTMAASAAGPSISLASNPPIATSSPLSPLPSKPQQTTTISNTNNPPFRPTIQMGQAPGLRRPLRPPNHNIPTTTPSTLSNSPPQSRPPHLASRPTPVYPEVNPPPERPCSVEPALKSLAFQRKEHAIADPQTS